MRRQRRDWRRSAGAPAGPPGRRDAPGNRGQSGVDGDGNVGTEYVAKASPDGHTLLFVVPGPMVINKSLYGKLAFDPDTMVPVSVVATITNVLAVHPRLAAGSVQQLITFAKANPGRLNYATQAIGSVAHLTGELFQSMAGISIVHIPYKGAAPAIADLLRTSFPRRLPRH